MEVSCDALFSSVLTLVGVPCDTLFSLVLTLMGVSCDALFSPVLTVTNEDVLSAYAQRAADFEDCLLATCAKSNRCDAIVTRNKKDFLSFGITLLLPEELLALFPDKVN